MSEWPWFARYAIQWRSDVNPYREWQDFGDRTYWLFWSARKEIGRRVVDPSNVRRWRIVDLETGRCLMEVNRLKRKAA